jgi:hypothetical protein
MSAMAEPLVHSVKFAILRAIESFVDQHTIAIFREVTAACAAPQRLLGSVFLLSSESAICHSLLAELPGRSIFHNYQPIGQCVSARIRVFSIVSLRLSFSASLPIDLEKTNVSLKISGRPLSLISADRLRRTAAATREVIANARNECRKRSRPCESGEITN